MGVLLCRESSRKPIIDPPTPWDTFAEYLSSDMLSRLNPGQVHASSDAIVEPSPAPLFTSQLDKLPKLVDWLFFHDFLNLVWGDESRD